MQGVTSHQGRAGEAQSLYVIKEVADAVILEILTRYSHYLLHMCTQ